MPLIRHRLQAQGLDQNNQPVDVPGPVAMQMLGPRLLVTVSLAQPVAAQMTANGQTVPQPIVGQALIDTGASVTCIDEDIAKKLGIQPVDVAKMHSASHKDVEVGVYPIHFDIAGMNVGMDVPKAMGAQLQSQGLIMLIGRDVLQHCSLTYHGFIGEFVLAL